MGTRARIIPMLSAILSMLSNSFARKCNCNTFLVILIKWYRFNIIVGW